MKIYQEKIQTEIIKENLKQSVQNLDQEIKDARKKGLELILTGEKGSTALDTKTLVQSLQEKLIMVLNSIDEDKIKKGRLAHLIKGMRIISENLSKIATGADKVVEHRNINLNINLEGKSREELLQILSNHANKNYN